MATAIKMVSMQQDIILSMQSTVNYSKYKGRTINNVSPVSSCNKSLNATKSVKSIDFYQVINENVGIIVANI